MENLKMKIPTGYRFLPTEEELVLLYLRQKALNLPLPASIIPECDIFQNDPWDLPGDLNEDRYFFSKKCDNESNKKNKRKMVGSGYWKPVGKVKQVLESVSNRAVGLRKAFVFCQTNPSDEINNTRWLLHQFSLTTQVLKKEDWLVFRVFQKKRRSKKHGAISNQTKHATAVSNSLSCCIEDSSLFSSPPPQPSSPSIGP